MVSNVLIDDLKKFNELGSVVNSNFSNLFNLKALIDSSYDYVYGYYDENDLVGFIHITKLYETMDIVNIVVEEKFRNRGIGNFLIEYVIKLFNDIESIMLEVNENNNAAISLYEKNGFKIINKRNNYYGADAALIMKRVVDNERC